MIDVILPAAWTVSTFGNSAAHHPAVVHPIAAAAPTTIGTLIVVPVVVAVLTAIGTMLVTKAGDAANRRRDRYAQAVATLVAWVEFPYRVRRRTDDLGPTLSALAAQGHDLQERLACNQAWIATEHVALAEAYKGARATIDAVVGPAIIEAWNSPAITTAVDMNLGAWGPGSACAGAIAEVQALVQDRFGWRRLRAFVKGQ